MATLLFDLDGTLSDPKLGITRSIQYALRKLGFEAPEANELTWCIGPPLLGSLESLLANTADAEAALVHFRERFVATGIYENELYPGIMDALGALKVDGHRLFVETSKPKVFAERIIAHFELGEFFDAIYGPDLDDTRSGKSKLLAVLVRDEQLDPSQTTMIGDRAQDIIAGRENDLSTLGVLYGYGSETELRSAGADQLCPRPHDLINHLGA